MGTIINFILTVASNKIHITDQTNLHVNFVVLFMDILCFSNVSFNL